MYAYPQYGVSMALVVVTFILLVYLWIKKHIYSLSRVKGPSTPGRSLLGSQEDVCDEINRCSYEYESPFKVWLGTKLVLCVTKPEHLELILNHQSTLNKSSMYDEVKLVFGSSLGTAPAEKWKRLRKLNRPLFDHSAVNSYTPIFNDLCKQLVKEIQEKFGEGTIDPYPLIADITIQSACEIFLGDRMKEMDGGSYLTNISKITPLVVRKLTTLHFLAPLTFYLSKYGIEYGLTGLKILSFNKKILQKKKKMIQQKATEPSESKRCVLDSFLNLSDFTEQDYKDEVQTMIVSSGETSTASACFILLVLGLYPDVQDKVFKEIESVLGDTCEEITMKNAGELQYLEKVIMETVRMFPVLSFLGRLVSKDLMLDTIKLPKGTEILIPVFAIHRNPAYWENPLKFDPERFSPEQVSQRHSYAFIGFSGGIRNCIGKRFGIVLLKIIIAHIVRTYKIKCGYKGIDSIEFEQAFVLKPKHGFKVSFEERSTVGVTGPI